MLKLGTYFRSAVLLALALTAGPALAERIAIIGTGDVAGALGPEFAAQGHEIVYGSRDPSRQSVAELVDRTGSAASATGQAESVAAADIVVLAVPGNVAADVARELDLSGKIVIDPTNVVAGGPDGAPAYPVPEAAGSNAQLIQAAASGARVVKAFNTLNYRTMVNPQRAGGPVSIPIAGDDAAAKQAVAELVAGMGLEPIDVGPLRYARVLEEMLVVWANALRSGTPYNYYFRPEPAQ